MKDVESAKVGGLEWSEEAPTKSRSTGHGPVEVFGADDSLFDQVQCFAKDGELQSVADESGHIPADVDRLFSEFDGEFEQLLDQLRIGLVSRGNLNQRHQLGGVPPVKSRHLFGSPGGLAEGGDRESGGV